MSETLLLGQTMLQTHGNSSTHLTIVGSYYNDGTPNDYAKKFDKEGMCLLPGWIYEIAYDADSTPYYDPPRSLSMGKRIVSLSHEKWLQKTI
jgi:hypothetical protein